MDARANKSIFNKETLAIFCSENTNSLSKSLMAEDELSTIVSIYDEILNFSNGIEQAKDIYGKSKHLIEDINDYPFIKSFLEL